MFKISNCIQWLIVLLLLAANMPANAQTDPKGTTITFFTQDGQPFFLIIDGKKVNTKAETNVKAVGLTGVSIMVKIIFKDETIKPHDERFSLTGVDPGYYNLTYAIRWNEKKKRMYTKLINWENQTPTANNDDNTPPGKPGGTTGTNYGSSSETTTVTTPGMDVNISIPDNNTQISIPTIGVQTHEHSSTTTTTIRTRTGNEGHQAVVGNPNANGCVNPMAPETFKAALGSLKSANFESSKLEQAKVMAKRNCLSINQVKAVMESFGFEESKLEFAKAAFPRCTDRNNYYLVNDAFNFSSSRDELNNFISNTGE